MKTDGQLQRDVMAELHWEPSVHVTQIGVEVKDGAVTLAGTVPSYSAMPPSKPRSSAVRWPRCNASTWRWPVATSP